MRVQHVKPTNDPSLGSFDDEAICYRTEVANTNDVPIRVIWFQYFIEQHGQWCGYNIRNRVLREGDFEQWYSDGDTFENGWIPPGSVAACDPNWHGPGCEGEFPRVKWSFIAVDANGRTYFGEAEVGRNEVSVCRRDEG